MNGYFSWKTHGKHEIPIMAKLLDTPRQTIRSRIERYQQVFGVFNVSNNTSSDCELCKWLKDKVVSDPVTPKGKEEKIPKQLFKAPILTTKSKSTPMIQESSDYLFSPSPSSRVMTTEILEIRLINRVY